MRPVTEDYQPGGNAEVTALFERWLERARKGKLRYAAVIGCESPTIVDVEQAGVVGYEFAANYGLDRLKTALTRTEQGPASQLGADFACYDLRTAPMGFDFANWLVEKEMTRVREGAPAPLKVGFIPPGQDRKVTESDHRMFANVIRPMLTMIGAVEDRRAVAAVRQMEFYCFRTVTEAAEAGEAVPKLAPSAKAVEAVRARLGGAAPVTITLREAKHWPHRNSNLEAWTLFADDLAAAGERVIVIRDTEYADAAIPGIETCPAASRDLHIRLALYEQARCNLFVANGPWALAAFGSRPWLMFLECREDDPFYHNKPDNWSEYCGVPIGGQFPWSAPDQRIVWARDLYENLHAAWAEFAPTLSRAA